MTMTLQAKPDRPGRRERSREQLMDAAFTFMADRSLAEISIADIAQSANLSVGTFYNHFPTREALGDAVVLHAAERHLSFLDWVASAESDPNRALALRIKATVQRGAVIRAWASFAVRFGLTAPVMRQALSGGPLALRSVAGSAWIELEAVAAAITVAMLVLVAERRSDGRKEGESAAQAILSAAGLEPNLARAVAASTPLPNPER
jgi:AcrR family transcriptional regulator